ncbi:MAG: 1,4-dihydroxy-2-naphthoate polyprenyltransferase [Candidatus Promineifilaceae bacterium]|nr:1,4-dihydroxy-2-naphthoate polyprenyltransferase [Candidatus Promineifilaceae bacterium]
MRTRAKAWVSAARPRTLTLAVAGILLGILLAAAEGRFDLRVASLTIWTAVLLQILSNLANDYGDSVHGADGVQRIGPARAVGSGSISAERMRLAMVVTGLLAAASGLVLVLVALGETLAVLLLFAALGLLAIWAAIAYTAGRMPYGYAGLGDLAVLVFFGWLSVAGAYYLQAVRLPALLLLPASTVGLFSVAVLNLNNLRDADSDRLSGKRTVAVRLGWRRARFYHGGLLVSGFALAVLYVALTSSSPWAWIFLLTVPALAHNALAVWRRPAEELDPLLGQMSLTTLLFSLTLGFGQLFS